MTAASKRLWQASPLTYIAMVIACILSIFPIYFMFMIATRTNDVIYDIPPPLTPGSSFTDNWGRVLANEQASFLYGLMNSIIVSSVVTLAVVLTSSLAGFAFAKLRFKGSGALLLGVLITMMVPIQLGIIPLYDMMVNFFGWQSDLKAVILPFIVSGFGVFMMRQYASQAIPDELIEAARVDGCSTFRIYWNIVLPVLRPAAAVLALLTFMQTWNEFIWAFTILDSETPTVQYSLSQLASAYYTDYAQVFAATAIATVPLLLVFLVFGKQIVGGIMEGSVKS